MKPHRLLIALLALCLPTLAADNDEPLRAFFRQCMDTWFEMSPSSGSELGDRRFDARLDEVSPAARAVWPARHAALLAELPRRVDRAKLSPDGQVDYDILEHEMQARLWSLSAFDPYAEDPRVYGDLITGSVYTLLAQSSAPRDTNIANAIARMRQIPRVVDAARASLRRPPRAHTETAIRQNLGAIAFYEKDLLELAGDSPKRAELEAAAAMLLPSLREHQRFLEQELLPRADGEWRIGLERFTRKFELETDTGASADQIYADAQAEFARVRNDLYVIARQLWSRRFPGQALPPDDEEGRRATIAAVMASVAQEHGDPARLVDDIRAGVDRIRAFIRRADILRLPEPDLCEIVEMPEFKRGNSTAYMSSPPPLDTAARGFYAVSPPPASWDAARVRSYLEEYNSHMQQILTIHEAYPGHYVQLEYSNRNPSLVRKVLGSGVTIEGWAVYTEQMMLDQGYGEGDLALRLNQLKFYLRAVTNTLLDRRMHCEGMTDEQAMDLLVRQAFQSEGEARLKLIRSKQSSVQLSTYFTGRMAHYRLRQRLQRELGDSFSLGRYHEAVLSAGSVPAKFLPPLVRRSLGLSPAAASSP